MKNIAPIAALFACALLLLAPSPADTQRAVVIHDSGCNLLLPNGSIAILAANRDVRVYTAGPGMRMCNGQINNPTGRAIHLDARNTGMQCEVNGEPTSDWRETISASGQASLHCRLR